MTWYDNEHDKMKYGGKEKHDHYEKYGGHDYDDKNDKKT